MARKTYRLTAMDSIRGIFALMIVWHHLAEMFGIPYEFDFGNSIVLFFFVVSGFHISLGWGDKIEGREREFILKRCVKIFPLQWLTLGLFLLFGINLVSWWAVPFHATLTQSLIPSWKVNFTLNLPSWFLSSLFFCYLATPLVLKFAKKHLDAFLILFVSAVVCWLLMLIVLPDSIGHRWLCYINPIARSMDYFLGISMGLVLGRSPLWKSMKGGDSRLAFTLLEIVAVLAFVVTMVHKPIIQLNSYTALRYPVVAVFILTFTLSKGWLSALLKNRVLAVLGGISMEIYMIHGFILWFLAKTDLSQWVRVPLTYALIIATSYTLSAWILPPVYRFLSGRANPGARQVGFEVTEK